MKTSVKILLGVVLVIFMIPTVFLMVFNFRAKGRDFKREEVAYEAFQRIDIGPTRFIKVQTPVAGVFKCELIPDDKPYYTMPKGGQGGGDSVRVEQKGDTLLVNYVHTRDKNLPEGQENYNNSGIELHISDWEQLEINGANVTTDASFGKQYGNKQINIVDGSLDLGKGPLGDRDYYEDTTSNNSQGLMLSGLNLTSKNSDIAINNSFRVTKIQLGLDGGKLKIGQLANVGAVEGFVSGNTALRMTGAYLQKLSGLIVK
jgi:hypothetical protein